MITFYCTACGQCISAPDHLAGVEGTCGRCGNKLAPPGIPGARGSSPAASPTPPIVHHFDSKGRPLGKGGEVLDSRVAPLAPLGWTIVAIKSILILAALAALAILAAKFILSRIVL